MMYFLKEILKKFLPNRLLNFYHFLLTFLGALIFGFPSKNLKVIGVTGTNGKSTTVEFIAEILKEAGFKVASISSIRFRIGQKGRPNLLKMTMPEGFFVQKFLKEAKRQGCDWVVLEVTSQGILQHRHRFIKFDIAILTNLLPEHIEAHGGFENYKKTKGKLFEATKNIHIINLDDKNAEYFLRFFSKVKYGFRIKNNQEKRINEVDKIIEAEDIEEEGEGIKFSVYGKKIYLSLLGRFNVYNALASIGVALSQGISLDVAKRALEKIKNIPGRMEVVIDKPFKAIIDYAVTPDALEEIYKEIQRRFSPKKMTCIFGACGGGRDKWKRPKLGEIAANYCDKIILTNEDPYDEDPSQILSDIRSGISQEKQKAGILYEILDRRQAIRKAIELAVPGDVVIITGKGSEPWMCVAGGKKIPWDDRKIVREEFQRIQNLS